MVDLGDILGIESIEFNYGWEGCEDREESKIILSFWLFLGWNGKDKIVYYLK